LRISSNTFVDIKTGHKTVNLKKKLMVRRVRKQRRSLSYKILLADSSVQITPRHEDTVLELTLYLSITIKHTLENSRFSTNAYSYDDSDVPLDFRLEIFGY
jgi:hypothetical protein